MKSGMSVTELATEVKRQEASKRDFYAKTNLCSIVVDDDRSEDKNGIFGRPDLSIDFGDSVPEGLEQNHRFSLDHRARRQIEGHFDMPAKFADKLYEDFPDLYQSTLSGMLARSSPTRQLVRTLDNNARAFLSDRYQVRDNWALLETVMPVISQLKDARVASCNVSSSRLYLKVVFPGIEGEVSKGDIVRSGFSLSNSEIGDGTSVIEGFFERLACTNGMILSHSFRKAHLGRHIRGTDDAFEFFSDETKRLDDAAFFSKVRDAVGVTADRSRFDQVIRTFRESKGREISMRADLSVEELSKKFRLGQDEHKGVLDHLIKGGDLTQWGLANAVTRTAEDVTDYDRATELERLGGRVIEMSSSDWKSIAVSNN